jgi:hypothetical protein
VESRGQVFLDDIPAPNERSSTGVRVQRLDSQILSRTGTLVDKELESYVIEYNTGRKDLLHGVNDDSGPDDDFPPNGPQTLASS